MQCPGTKELSRFLGLVCLIILSCTSPGLAQSGGNLAIPSSTISGGGGVSAGGDSQVLGTIGQSIVEASTGGAFSLSGGINAQLEAVATPSPTPTSLIQLSQSTLSVSEGAGAAPITITRSGDTSQPATVFYATADASGLNECSAVTGIASARCDYAVVVGTLLFAPGEQAKTIYVPLIDDAYLEGPENFTLTLSNAAGAGLGQLSTMTVTITDNDLASGANPIEATSFFVRQHYIDFLGREPEPSGLQDWQNILNNCGASIQPPCDRIEVSSDFFRSEEFQQRGYFIYRFYAASLGRTPHYNEFIPDMARVSGFLNAQDLEAAKVGFISDFMNRQVFITKYAPTLNDSTAYVNLLEQTAGVTLSNKQALITGLQNSTETRATVLRKVIESVEVGSKFFNEAFVVEAYFGYLRRDPDILYLDWIQTLNRTNDYRSLVNGFLNSIEYRKRFGP